MTPAFHHQLQCSRCKTLSIALQPIIDGHGASWKPPKCPNCHRTMKLSPFDLVEGERLSTLLDELWSPALRELGIEPCGPNTWAEPGVTSFRRMVSLGRLRGAGAVGVYGLSLGFVPTMGRNELVYHRTQKAARMDVRNAYPADFLNADRGARISLYNSLVATATLQACIGSLVQAAQEWFTLVHDLDSLERFLRESDSNPERRFSLAFVEAVRGNFEDARALLRTMDPPGIREEFIDKALQKARTYFL